MKYEIRDCIDAGTEYCPCHLAETGNCILCSQLSDKTFCDCINWKGFCVFNDYISNGLKAKPGRQSYLCSILKREELAEKLIMLTILIPHKAAKGLAVPGSFVFLRNPKSDQFYDVPISIMEIDMEENLIKVVIEVKGVKTKNLEVLQQDDRIIVRGPYWNGILGLKNINSCSEGCCILIGRGIGIAPLIPVLKKLSANGNKTTVIIDKSPYKSIFLKEYMEVYDADIIEINTLDNNGKLPEEFKVELGKLIKGNKVNLVHCAGPDILNHQVYNALPDSIPFSCCNNARMCCGEGVCGSCSVKNQEFKIERSCKLQTEPKNIIEGRKLL